jgi:hypothetical protein
MKVASGVEKALEDYKHALKGKADPEIERQKMVDEIRETFLRYFVNIFKSYEKFMVGMLILLCQYSYLTFNRHR